ncbi:hypothetical protein GC197_12295 [bacterium]|nr:hypothetical protein [bacterium]
MLLKTLVWSGILSVVTFSMVSTAKADHFTCRHRLVDDIEYLHHEVEDFYQEVRYHETYGPLASEARALLNEVDHFCETARRQASLNHLKADFADVSREMKHVQQELRSCWHACHHHHGDQHILQAWINIEQAFDRVYYDLYEAHCGYIQYRCQIPVQQGPIYQNPYYGNGHNHGYNPGYNNGYGNGYGQYKNQGGMKIGFQNGKVNVQIGGKPAGWGNLIKAFK